MAEQTTPTPEQMQQMQSVSQAGAQAAATAEPGQEQEAAREAMRSARDRVNLQMSDEDIDRVAAALSPKLIEGFREHGAFDPPPEAVHAPPERQAPPPPGEEQPAPPPAAGAEAPPQAPRKRTVAERFFGS